MVEIAVFPLSARSRFEARFEPPVAAEGSLGWLKLLAETTLIPVRNRSWQPYSRQDRRERHCRLLAG